MKLEELYKEFDSRLEGIHHLDVSNHDAWADDNGEPAFVGDKNVQLDVQDNDIRKKVYFNGIFNAIKKANWHTSLIKSVEDVKKHLTTIEDGYGLFPNYLVFLNSDFKMYRAEQKKIDKELKTRWKTDIELFKDCIYTIIEGIDLSYYFHFISEFDRNDFGIKWEEDVVKNAEIKEYAKDVIFNFVSVNRKYNEED